MLTIIILFQSCETDHTGGGCPKYDTNYQTISASAISQTPYFTNKAFDTISFASNKGDTLTFVKTKTDTTWYCEDDNSNPNCPREKANCYQTLHNTYATIKGNGSFDVVHSKKNNELPNLLEITLNNLILKVEDYRIGSKNGTIYFDNIIKGNNLYTKAIKFFHNLNDSNIGEGFINKDFGCFTIKNNLTNVEFNYIQQ
jgi:hypothetical protein